MLPIDGNLINAGVIGTNWGRVHIAGLRQAGCQVSALIANDQQLVTRIATEEQIPFSGTELSLLAPCELVTIATPTATHLTYLQAIQDKPILCEKPLGLTPDNQEQFNELHHDCLYISYPFPHLDTAKRLHQEVKSGQLGKLNRICLVVGVNLPYAKTSVEWFVEDVVHPFSFLYTLFDDFQWQGVQFGQGNNLSVQLTCQGALFDILLCDWPMPGLHFDLTIVGSKNAYQLRGGFRPERGWWFDPLLADATAITPGEPITCNPWIRANHRVIQHFVECDQGTISQEEAYQLGMFDFARAKEMESLFLPLWLAAGQHQTETETSPQFNWHLTL